MSDTREAVARVIHAGAVGKGFPVAKMAPEWMPFLPEADAAISAYRAALEAEGFVVVRRPPTIEERERALEDFCRWAEEIAPDCTERARAAFGSLLQPSNQGRPADPGAAAMRDHL